MAKKICGACYSTRGEQTYTPAAGYLLFFMGLGSCAVSMVVLLPLLILGSIMVFVALCIGRKRCRECKADGPLVPLSTPRGRELQERAFGAVRPQMAAPACGQCRQAWIPGAPNCPHCGWQP